MSQNPSDTRAAAEAFTKALHRLEQTKDPQVMLERFADDCTLLALVDRREHSGTDGARAFWEEYLKPFEKISSNFTHVAADGSLAVLEWTGTGTFKGGHDIEYDGCSLLEFDDHGKVKRFRTYYDSAAFLPVKAD